MFSYSVGIFLIIFLLQYAVISIFIRQVGYFHILNELWVFSLSWGGFGEVFKRYIYPPSRRSFSLTPKGPKNFGLIFLYYIIMLELFKFFRHWIWTFPEDNLFKLLYSLPFNHPPYVPTLFFHSFNFSLYYVTDNSLFILIPFNNKLFIHLSFLLFTFISSRFNSILCALSFYTSFVSLLCGIDISSISQLPQFPSSERSSGLASVNKVFFLFLLGIDFILGFIFCSLETQYAGLDIDKYMLAEGVGLSDIVSILFAGIHYTYSNLSENSQRFVSTFFHLISSLAETFLYIQGFDIAMEQHSWSHAGFIFFLIIFIVVARAANVFSCGYLVNLARPTHRKIPPNHLKALWYSGHGQTIFTATTTIVVLTVLLIRGSTNTMLETLHVVGDGHDGQLGESFEGNHGYLVPSQSFKESHGYLVPPFDEKPSSGNIIKLKLKEFHK
ncbi:hypothetical protein UlMin_023459, partial [Ulmus minor]